MSDIQLFYLMKPVVKTFTVTLEVYHSFQNITGDMNPLHTDKSFALSKGFPECVMYGNILNGFISTMIGMCLPTPNIMIATQNINFKKPVYLNDKLECKMQVEDVFESVDTVGLKFSFKNENGIIVAKGHVQIIMLKN